MRLFDFLLKEPHGPAIYGQGARCLRRRTLMKKIPFVALALMGCSVESPRDLAGATSPLTQAGDLMGRVVVIGPSSVREPFWNWNDPSMSCAEEVRGDCRRVSNCSPEPRVPEIGHVDVAAEGAAADTPPFTIVGGERLTFTMSAGTADLNPWEQTVTVPLYPVALTLPETEGAAVSVPTDGSDFELRWERGTPGSKLFFLTEKFQCEVPAERGVVLVPGAFLDAHGSGDFIEVLQLTEESVDGAGVELSVAVAVPLVNPGKHLVTFRFEGGEEGTILPETGAGGSLVLGGGMAGSPE